MLDVGVTKDRVWVLRNDGSLAHTATFELERDIINWLYIFSDFVNLFNNI